MGIPLWSSPQKGLDPNSASSRTNAQYNTNLDSATASQEPLFSSSSSSASSSASSTSLLNVTTTQQINNNSNSSSNNSSTGSNGSTDNRSWSSTGDGPGLLTLGEFLRETAASDDNERQLNGILRLRPRTVAAEYSNGSDRSRGGDFLFVPAPLSPPPPPPTNWNYSGLGNLFDHTPAGRARILGTMGSTIGGSQGTSGSASASSGAGGASTATAASAPPASSSSSTASASAASMSAATIARDQTTFANLVDQIRRIGELQDFVLSSAGDANNPENPDRVAAEGEARIASALGNSESRLRAMQTSIDLLASEFQLLRNTRRELRRVEEEALETLQNSSGTAGSSRGTRPVPAIPAAQPTSSSPRSHSGRREPRALINQRFRRFRAEGRLPDLSDDETDSYEYPPVFTNLTSVAGHTGRHRNAVLARNPGFRLGQGNPLRTQTPDVDSQRQEAVTGGAETEVAEQTEREEEGENDYTIPSTEARDRMLLDIVMRMQIEGLQNGGLSGL
ncbi:unnamed protein product [Tuber melanosporum]|uniref:(Perigord truffle) hypothetical protein n=1 Tax=Tuber melanosporum (strain Mel28) TaxID=656061 RepID=D5G3V4_TUBMM|nr:uncharacterized protein GSTUM_00003818001 [Tuber melanosporum]CAZ79197.1 unnamed protein product [Tuber melanosporum]